MPHRHREAPKGPWRSQSLSGIFLRFLRFGLLAWGGPVAQIAMIRQELVEEERWVTPERFNRALAVYQALPGPEAHELCVYFGMLARGRMGGLLAGLGFMLPGLVLMLVLSWFYLQVGLRSPFVRAAFTGAQAAVVALVFRAVHRIGQHALTTRRLFVIALMAAAAELAGVHFLITLAAAGLANLTAGRRSPAAAVAALLLLSGGTAVAAVSQAAQGPSLAALFGSGLRTGLLTFGGAYTAIPFLQHDAVYVGGWLTDAQFLDGLALSGVIPAPLIIFSTFVGYLGGGLSGALVMTAGVFLPAFAFTLVGYDLMERLIGYGPLHAFLDGVTAGVVGLIAATALRLFGAGVHGLAALAIFAAALAVLYRWKAKATVAAVVLGAGALGLILFR